MPDFYMDFDICDDIQIAKELTGMSTRDMAVALNVSENTLLLGRSPKGTFLLNILKTFMVFFFKTKFG